MSCIANKFETTNDFKSFKVFDDQKIAMTEKKNNFRKLCEN